MKFIFLFIFFFLKAFIYLFSCARSLTLVAACEIEPGPPALGARSLSHWTTRDIPRNEIYLYVQLS